MILPNRIVRRIFPGIPPIPIDGPSGSRVTHHPDALNGVLHVRHVSSCDQRTSFVPYLQLLLTVWAAARMTIDVLHDEVLLHIFHFDRLMFLDGLEDDRVTYLDVLEGFFRSWRWDRLIHVCQRWRSVVFSAPKSLDLRLVCGPSTRVELAGIWPPLPIIIKDIVGFPMPEDYDFNASIVDPNRVCEINLQHLTSSQLQRLASTMQEQFPALTHLRLDGYYNRPVPALPDRFLGGSAPRLQSLQLHSIPFPSLPNLLLSATDLVDLILWNIPHSGYISPEMIATSLAVLANLKSLAIGFEFPLSSSDRESQRPLPSTFTTLPALARFQFQGASEYLEDFVARIEAPLLDSIRITFSHQLIFFIPQLAQFVRRTARFEALNETHVDFDYSGVKVESLPLLPTQTSGGTSKFRISCEEWDQQLLSLTQVFRSSLPSIHVAERLYISGSRYLPSQWQDDIESMEWLRAFTLVKNLYVSKEFAQFIASVLAGDRMTDVLPALETLFLEETQPSGPVQEALEPFVAARRLLGCPVAVSRWNMTREAY